MPRIPLPPTSTAELPIDPPALVPLRPEDMEAARDLLLAARHIPPDAVSQVALRARDALAVAPDHPGLELDVGSAAGHVGRDRDRAAPAGTGDDPRFLLVVLRVQDAVGNPLPLQEPA